MTAIGRQLALPFVHAPTYGPDFLAAASNAAALAWLARVETWPQGRLALWGGAGSGKTHLLHVWARRHATQVQDAALLVLAPVTGPIALDDADAAPALPLLHTLNAAAEAGYPVLIAGRTPPARWNASPADLASRLRAITAVELGPPEESLLRALLARLLAERQLAVPQPLQDWMLLRLPRTAAAIRAATARLDRACLLAGTRPTRALAQSVVVAVNDADAAVALQLDDDLADAPQRTSPDAVEPL